VKYNNGWVGVDLDGTLAKYDGWKGPQHIGEPIMPMVEKIKQLLTTGVTVKIFTARVCSTQPKEELEIAQKTIAEWTKQYIGQTLEATAEKDWNMIEYYDDRAIRVTYNLGIIE
jgi:hypothetical protein